MITVLFLGQCYKLLNVGAIKRSPMFDHCDTLLDFGTSSIFSYLTFTLHCDDKNYKIHLTPFIDIFDTFYPLITHIFLKQLVEI